MNLSNIIAHMISEMMENQDEVEIQRNTLAQTVGCVPSQINYVLASRFTPERGYIVESRRGGGGYIKITRIHCDRGTALMHTLNAIGDTLDEKTCRSHLVNLVYLDLLTKRDASLLLAATGDNALRLIDPARRDAVRAAIFKQMLLALQT
ncbi:MAG: CtsR family transcriptional regulator [Clostridia bacterium]|nr:CtsR family transcriptional regulator [Clostridia bacterium]